MTLIEYFERSCGERHMEPAGRQEFQHFGLSDDAKERAVLMKDSKSDHKKATAQGIAHSHGENKARDARKEKAKTTWTTDACWMHGTRRPNCAKVQIRCALAATLSPSARSPEFFSTIVEGETLRTASF